MQNIHKHSYYSNLFSADAIPSYEDYAKRANELGHKVLSSVEHGWQGYYHQVYEVAKKYDLKCVIGTEAYWVKDRHEQDRSNHHIIICAKSNMGREAINDILSEANISGYYYRPRVDLELLMSLPPKDVFLTSACIAFSGYEDVDSVIKQLHDYFGENFMLEIQSHNTPKQIAWNSHLLELSKKWGIELFAGIDSHYIYPQDNTLRDDLLASKDVHYEDEEGWFMDYPDDITFRNRLIQQQIFTDEEITKAMDNPNLALDFCDYDGIRIFTKDIKLPSLYPDKTQEEKNKIYSDLIHQKLEEYLVNIPKEKRQEYRDGVDSEIQTYIDTGMVDYPLLDYAIVNRAIDEGCLVTSTGRGSAVGYFTNTLCGFSKVDRFTSAIKLYPERFISTTRILETKSLPDIDLNTGTPDILEEAQKEVMGERHAVPMIAFGTLKKKSAFKIYAKSQNMEFELANKISEQISKYDEAVKLAEDDEKDDIKIEDYVDKKYLPYLEQSEKYWGIISDKKKAPSAYLLYDGDIRREIGLIKCKSESTKKEYITCCIDGAIAENYKFLKNDILKVDVVLLIAKVFQRIGIDSFNVNELIKKVSTDQKVWDLYAKGYTVGLNQVEKEGSTKKCVNYKPHNVSELSAFVAAIRPGFKSMYDKFEQRVDFKWGIPSLDNLLRTKELPVSFLFFQEQVMSVLNYAGFPMDECYGIIKAIAKKHPEKVKPLKEKFIVGFKNKLIETENLSDDVAQKNAERVWVIINDNCGYGFNSSHAFCMALDSLYQAWQKANYPYEFYEVLLQHYSEKGNKEKVAALKKEMKTAFGIISGSFKFGKDNRTFVSDKDNHVIYPAMKSIKGLNNQVSEELYTLSQECVYDNFIDLLIDIKEKTILKKDQLDILVKLDYFSDFGEINELLYIIDKFNKLYEKGKGFKANIKQLKLGLDPEFVTPYCKERKAMEVKEVDFNAMREALKNSEENLLKLNEMIGQCERHKKTGEFNGYNYEKFFKISQIPDDMKFKYATKISEAEYKGIDAYKLLSELEYHGTPMSVKERVKNQIEFLSYIDYVDPKLDKRYVMVTNLNTNYSPKFVAYCLNNGKTSPMKVRKNKKGRDWNVKNSFKDTPFEEGDILFMIKCKQEPKAVFKDGAWTRDYKDKEWWLYEYKVQR